MATNTIPIRNSDSSGGNNKKDDKKAIGPPTAAPAGQFFGTPLTFFPRYSMYDPTNNWANLPPPGQATFNQTAGIWGVPPVPSTPLPTPTPTPNPGGGGGSGGGWSGGGGGMIGGGNNNGFVDALKRRYGFGL